MWVANAVATVWKGEIAASHTSKRASVRRKRRQILFTSTSMLHAGIRPFALNRRQRRQRPSHAVTQTTTTEAINATAALTATGATAVSLKRPVLLAGTLGVQTCAAVATPASRLIAIKEISCNGIIRFDYYDPLYLNNVFVQRERWGGVAGLARSKRGGGNGESV